MTTTKDIMNAIQELAAKEISELKRIYTNLVPKEFKRPCLLIEPVTTSNRDANKALIKTTPYFTLTVYDTTDDYSHSDTGALLDLQEKVLSLFRAGYIRVGDRALHVEASTGGREWDKAFVDVQLSYHDLRDETPDTTPLMLEVQTRINPEGD